MTTTAELTIYGRVPRIVSRKTKLPAGSLVFVIQNRGGYKYLWKDGKWNSGWRSCDSYATEAEAKAFIAAHADKPVSPGPQREPEQPYKDRTEPPAGLYNRYVVSKADGTPTDQRAFYFVLRLDSGGDDRTWIDACRQAAKALIWQLRLENHLTLVADNLEEYLAQFNHEYPSLMDLKGILKSPEQPTPTAPTSGDLRQLSLEAHKRGDYLTSDEYLKELQPTPTAPPAADVTARDLPGDEMRIDALNAWHKADNERERLEKELDAAVQHHSHWTDKLIEALPEYQRFSGDLLHNVLCAIAALREQVATLQAARDSLASEFARISATIDKCGGSELQDNCAFIEQQASRIKELENSNATLTRELDEARSGVKCFSCGIPWKSENMDKPCDMSHREHWGHEWVSQRVLDLTKLLSNANNRAEKLSESNAELVKQLEAERL